MQLVEYTREFWDSTHSTVTGGRNTSGGRGTSETRFVLCAFFQNQSLGPWTWQHQSHEPFLKFQDQTSSPADLDKH